jgi:NADH-quinone oxidoreductase subunit E
MSTAEAPLTPDELAQIAQFVMHYPAPRAACIDALKAVQSRRRYISDNTLAEIAGVLGMSTAELDEVATFYNLIFRKPVGENVIFLCDSVTCWMLGRDRVCRHITSRLGIGPGETTADNRFTLLPIVCLGACDRAPAMLLNGALLGDVTETMIDGLLALEAT